MTRRNLGIEHNLGLASLLTLLLLLLIHLPQHLLALVICRQFLQLLARSWVARRLLDGPRCRGLRDGGSLACSRNLLMLCWLPHYLSLLLLLLLRWHHLLLRHSLPHHDHLLLLLLLLLCRRASVGVLLRSVPKLLHVARMVYDMHVRLLLKSYALRHLLRGRSRPQRALL